MAHLETVPWFSIRRIMALIALLLEILVIIVPVPEWVQAVVIILLCLALLV